MKIFNILLSNLLIATSTYSTAKITSNISWLLPSDLYRKGSKKNYSYLLPFVEVNLNLEDYTHFQKEEDFDSIVDYITKSKKIDIDKILSDPTVETKNKWIY